MTAAMMGIWLLRPFREVGPFAGLFRSRAASPMMPAGSTEPYVWPNVGRASPAQAARDMAEHIAALEARIAILEADA